MSRPLLVLIAASDLLDGLRERFDDSDVAAFPDADVLRALETISLRRPGRVVLEQGFASTSRGAALVNRLKADPALAHVQVEVTSAGAPAARRRAGGAGRADASPWPRRSRSTCAARAARRAWSSATAWTSWWTAPPCAW